MCIRDRLIAALEFHLDSACFQPGGNLVLHQRITHHASVRIVPDVLIERHADALYNTALGLHPGQSRVDNRTTCLLYTSGSGVTDHDWIDEMAIKESIGLLSDREKKILSLRFLAGRTQTCLLYTSKSAGGPFLLSFIRQGYYSTF